MRSRIGGFSAKREAAVTLRSRFSVAGILSVILAATGLGLLPAAASMAATTPGLLNGGHRTAVASPHRAAPRLAHRSLRSILRADGTLRTRGVSGTFSASGYRMVLGHHGTPRFVRPSTAAAGDASWDDRFGLPGVQGGAVNAVAVDGGDVYVGGSFTSAGDAPHAYVAEWDGQAWQDLSGGLSGAPSGEDPEVDALAVNGNVLYVGGIFTTAHNGSAAVTAHDVAAWNTQTGTWSALGSGIAAGSTCSFCVLRVDALAVSGSTIFAAGSFGKAGSVAANSIAAWNGSAWSALGKGLWSCSACSPVQAAAVSALAVSGSTLYAGGSFDHAGTVAAGNIASWNITSSAWSAMGSGVVPGYLGGVFALAVDGTSLIVAGDFTKAGPVAVNSVAVWSGSAWSALDGAKSGVTDGTGSQASEGRVNALLISGTTLYLGGAFDHLLPGGTATQGGLASFSLATPGWQVLPMEQATATVNTFAAGTSSGVYVGGSFDTGGPLQSGLFLDNVGLLTGGTWSALGQGVTYGENARGFGIALAHGTAGEYAGGWFDQAGSVQTTGVALWNGTNWQSMGSGVKGGESPTGPTVQAIAVYKNQVFIGGDFSSVSGVKATDIAVYSNGAWHAVGGGTDGVVQSLAVSGGYLYAGGSFSKAGGSSVGAPVARWKLGTSLTSHAGWSALGPLFGAGGVTSIAFDGDWVILGGDLADCVAGSPCDDGSSTGTTACETASGYDINGLIMWNTEDPGDWYYPFGCGVTVGSGATATPGDVTTLLLAGSTLYVGGYFDQAGISGASPNQVAAMNIASLNLSVLQDTKTKWSKLGSGVGNDSNGDSVGSLASAGSILYAGGSFSSAGGVAATGVAQWNLDTPGWSALGDGLSCVTDDCTGSYANAVDAAPDGIYITGNFGIAGGQGSGNFARWTSPGS
jgi:trimeric autotransporter adhesin